MTNIKESTKEIFNVLVKLCSNYKDLNQGHHFISFPVAFEETRKIQKENAEKRNRIPKVEVVKNKAAGTKTIIKTYKGI